MLPPFLKPSWELSAHNGEERKFERIFTNIWIRDKSEDEDATTVHSGLLIIMINSFYKHNLSYESSDYDILDEVSQIQESTTEVYFKDKKETMTFSLSHSIGVTSLHKILQQEYGDI